MRFVAISGGGKRRERIGMGEWQGVKIGW